MLHSANIILHVSAGIIAIAMGVVAYASIKGGKTHRKFGRLFLAFISVVIITAFAGVLVFVDRPFLTIVTLQAAYLSYTGFRVTKLKGDPFQWPDLIILLVTATILGLFFLKMQEATIFWNQKVVVYIIFYLSFILGFDLLRWFLPRLITSQRFWLYDHIYRVTGAFSALISAGVGTIMAGFEPWNQIVPAVMSTLWLVFCLVWFSRKPALSPMPKAEKL